MVVLLAGVHTLGPPVSGATPPEPPGYRQTIPDVQFIPRTYYFLSDHPVSIQEGSLSVWRDDGIPSNNWNAAHGVARLDPSRLSDEQNPQLNGSFDLLLPGADYVVLTRRPDGPDGAVPVPVLRLSRPAHFVEVLAVTYIDEAAEPPVTVGNPSYEGLVAKALKVRHVDHWLGNDGLADPQAPWFPLLAHELRNVYDLGTRDIPVDRLRVTIRKLNPGGTDPDGVYGKSYLEHLGLDRSGNSNGVSAGPDGLVDSTYLDPVAGTLYFPDHHPFDPGTPVGPCPVGRGGFLCLDDLERNVLRRYEFEPLAQSNPHVYYDFNLEPSVDTRFYLDVVVPPPPKPGGVLRPNAPNPFNPGTTIAFELNTPDHARLEIYDVHGAIVRRLVDADFPAGAHRVFWGGEDRDGGNVSSGVYFYVLDTGGHRYSRKMVLTR